MVLLWIQHIVFKQLPMHGHGLRMKPCVSKEPFFHNLPSSRFLQQCLLKEIGWNPRAKVKTLWNALIIMKNLLRWTQLKNARKGVTQYRMMLVLNFHIRQHQVNVVYPHHSMDAHRQKVRLMVQSCTVAMLLLASNRVKAVTQIV